MPFHLEVIEMTIKQWYKTKYPTDTEGEYIKKGVTFGYVWEALVNGNFIYGVLGEVDSVVRERVFEEIAKQKGISYDTIYNLWIRC